ncbi:MAG: hypothetical protein ACRDAM_21245, partial [Casimicrobium sp.]
FTQGLQEANAHGAEQLLKGCEAFASAVEEMRAGVAQVAVELVERLLGDHFERHALLERARHAALAHFDDTVLALRVHPDHAMWASDRMAQANEGDATDRLRGCRVLPDPQLDTHDAVLEVNGGTINVHLAMQLAAMRGALERFVSQRAVAARTSATHASVERIET